MPSKGRRGTKYNPFEIGDRVLSKRLGSSGTGRIAKVSIGNYGDHTSYLVDLDNGKTVWLYTRDLTALED